MITVAEALDKVLEYARARAAASVPLERALGLVLAEDVTSDVDSPPHDKSIVDGYALAAAELARGIDEFDVVEEVTAGAVPTRTLGPAQATRIMTGAPVPAGADAVVMLEQTQTVDDGGGGLDRVKITESTTKAGQNIMRRGASLTRGATVVSRGTPMRPIEIGLLAEVGRSEVHAIPRPTVAVLPTGNELVAINEVPGPAQIRNSNGPMLVASAIRAGAEVCELAIGRDHEAALRELVERGLQFDILAISGGVSAGLLDLVPKVLRDAGVEQVFHKVSLKPGKPLWFGRFAGARGDTLVFGLPGNPVSSLVCFELFVRPAIGRLAGRADEASRFVPARLTVDYTHRGQRPTYHPARLERHEVVPLPWQGSGDLATLAHANALACFPGGDRTYAIGEAVETMLL